MKNQRGLTLIELMVTLAVFAVLVGLGLSGLSGYSTSNRLIALNNTISGELSVARSEAIKRGMSVIICASSDVTVAEPACDSTQWEAGWIAFVDADNSGSFNTSTDTLLAIDDSLPTGITLRTTGFDAAGEIAYRPNGALRGNTSGTVIVCDQGADPKKARAVNVSNIGRVSIATDQNADDIVDDVTNTSVTCP